MCCVAIFCGANSDLTLAWNLADIFMGFQAIINIVVILILGKWALVALRDYTEQKERGVDPVFIADGFEAAGMPRCECWHTDPEVLSLAMEAAPDEDKRLPDDDPAEWTELIVKE